MKIISIEPTPSPNVMKLNLDEHLPPGQRWTFTQENLAAAPELFRKLLAIPGVKSLFRTADFLSVERKAKADWQAILSKVSEIFDEMADAGGRPGSGALPAQEPDAGGASLEAPASPDASSSPDASASPGAPADPDSSATGGMNGEEERWREVQVYVQILMGIPTQVKLVAGKEERRVALPERFLAAAMEAQRAVPGNAILQRRWEEQGLRYGSLEEVADQVVQELVAAYDEARLRQLVQHARHPETEEDTTSMTASSLSEALADPDWKKRYAALQRMELTEDKLPVLVSALKDSHPSIRRLAVAYLGALGSEKALPYLIDALQDPSVAIRRTAGDALSDLGSPKAIAAMTKALFDPNKLVRWRAARFLYEVGDESALPALRRAQEDPEFEVRMQVKMAIERIERGEAASGTVWQQMTRLRQERGNGQDSTQTLEEKKETRGSE
ncbi:MAG: hypothetical protein BAA01_01315 [Bacillus thermozeamaize]|uniref:Scaffold protein Nfu/NifU N-terminal domain-containing protein n=1 Tax=Bacillus thermozeamaize TaxID=230954 RepID=A0A1Y3PIS0_9BACI|nr:MAG: hypothetical protein BAA01_01315 [Bacillus thermozeamaize]